jgi:RNA polymerase sigma-70 factor (ECF subfamily)
MQTQFASEMLIPMPFVATEAATQNGREESQELPLSFLPRLQAGDPNAFSDLYQMYRRRVFGIILKIVDSPTAAEDLVQESFLKLWRHSANLKVEYRLVGPWLMRVARNCALDYRKSNSHLRVEPIVSDHAVSTGFEEEAATWRRRSLQQAFLQLSAEQRQVIVMAFYQGLSQVEIAEQLGLPLGTIKGRVRLGLAKLRTAMERD